MTLTWNDLDGDEQRVLAQMHSAAHLATDVSTIDRLRRRGLVEQKLGGPGLSAKGKNIYEQYAMALIAARRRREGQ